MDKRQRERSRLSCLKLCQGFYKANMLNGCQSVCDLMKEKPMLSLSFSSFCHLSIIPRRLQGDQQNTIPAVCVCVECITNGD